MGKLRLPCWQLHQMLLPKKGATPNNSFGHSARCPGLGSGIDGSFALLGVVQGNWRWRRDFAVDRSCHEGSTPPLIYNNITISHLSSPGTLLHSHTLPTLTSATVRSSMIIMPPPNTRQCTRSQNLACRGPALRRIVQTGHHRTSHLAGKTWRSASHCELSEPPSWRRHTPPCIDRVENSSASATGRFYCTCKLRHLFVCKRACAVCNGAPA